MTKDEFIAAYTLMFGLQQAFTPGLLQGEAELIDLYCREYGITAQEAMTILRGEARKGE